MRTRAAIRLLSFVAAASALALALLLLAASPPPVAAEGPVYYDVDPFRWGESGGMGWGALPLVDYMTDCRTGGATSCGEPTGRWTSARIPVAFCTHQTNRPAYITAAQFRGMVTSAAETWNNQGLAIGIRYNGDCTGDAWGPGDGRNEITFDGERLGAAAGAALGRWQEIISGGQVTARTFIEFDVLLDGNRGLHPSCLQSVILHELGHVLGLGHSDVITDLMFPTFDPGDVHNCRQAPAADEVQALTALYGINRSPSIVMQPGTAVPLGSAVTLQATATDPEGDPLTFEWRQLSGPAVSLTSDGARATFTAPASDTTLAFALWARDPYLGWARETATVSVAAAGTVTSPPPPASAAAPLPAAPSTTQPGDPLASALPPSAAPPAAVSGLPGTFQSPLSARGHTIAIWEGGTIMELATALAAQGATSATYFRDGRPVVLVVGAPSFVNAAFRTAFPGEIIPPSTLLLVTKR